MITKALAEEDNINYKTSKKRRTSRIPHVGVEWWKWARKPGANQILIFSSVVVKQFEYPLVAWRPFPSRACFVLPVTLSRMIRNRLAPKSLRYCYVYRTRLMIMDNIFNGGR